MEATDNLPRYAKRKRLSTACSQCRKRKVRCDEQQPKCQNCVLRGDDCITFDVKDPSQQAVRVPASPAKILSVQQHESRAPSVSTERSPSQPCPALQSTKSEISGLPYQHASESFRDEQLGNRDIENAPLQGQQDELGSYDRETILNTDHTSYKRKFLGGGTLQALAKRIDLLFERKGLQPINTQFPFGMQHAEEMPLPSLGSGPNMPPLPVWKELDAYIRLFQEKIYPFYPVLDLSSFREDARRLSSLNLKLIANHDVPLLCLAYSVVGMAADEQAGDYSIVGWQFLTAAYGLLAYLISLPYLSSVQATLLLSVALRSRQKDGCARQTLGQAIRIAQSIGIHRNFEEISSTSGHNNYKLDKHLDSRIWWSCYSLEMSMSLEVGRPAALRDADCSQIMPTSQQIGSLSERHFLASMVGLAKIQSRLIDIFYHRPPSNRNASSLLHDIGLADQSLCEWAALVPRDIRPDSDLCCAIEELHLATHLSILYHQTMISVHQVALMIDFETYKERVAQNCSNNQHRNRLLGSEKILLNSARKIAELEIDLFDRGIRSHLITMTPIILATIILGLNMMKYPNAARNGSDMELLIPLSQLAEAQYTSAGQRLEFIQAITMLRSQIASAVRNTNIGPSTNVFPGIRISGATEQLPRDFSQWAGGRHTFANSPTDAGHAEGNLHSYLTSDCPWDWILSDEAVGNPMEALSWDVLHT
ncbi:fungal-specific transcription factor domain-containing protein [Tricladium varicosporioides]|nr:fungal-specific transcription factor domain-containing protein [Hymenoscyphus varicosporioides]